MARETEEKVAAPAKKSPVLLIVVIVNLTLALGAGAYVLTKSTAAAGAQGEVVLSGAAAIDPATFVTSEMQPFIVNLLDEDGNRYLKLQLVVRLRSEEARERFGTLQPAVRDRFIQHITSMGVQDLTSPEKKKELKRALVEGANDIVPRGDVVDVYFTDFVIQ